MAASREAIGHIETTPGLATARVVSASEADIARLRLKLAGLPLIVGER